MKIVRVLSTLCLLGLIGATAFAAPPPRERMWEYLINERVMDYPLKTENLFRLAVYTELKGNYMPAQDALHLQFGNLGQLQFFQGHCLLKTVDGQVYSVTKGESPTVQSESLDASLDQLFDRMPLLNDATGNPIVIAHVDDHLSRKNLEPFDKLFLRHLLVHYGRYNESLDAVEFHSSWLTENQTNESVISVPLKIRLDKTTLRGYYLNSGGTVYVEDVPRTVAYATGEEYGHNVTAFKVFMEELLVTSVQYVVQEETQRKPVAGARKATGPLPPGYATASSGHVVNDTEDTIEVLYAPEKWMNLMLGILRARNINIGERDIIRYFADESYFEKLYELLLPEEKQLVDKYLRRNSLAAQP